MNADIYRRFDRLKPGLARAPIFMDALIKGRPAPISPLVPTQERGNQQLPSWYRLGGVFEQPAVLDCVARTEGKLSGYLVAFPVGLARRATL